MTTTPLKSCWLSASLILCMQSLADIAREEAERRRLLDQQGIEAKVIDGSAIPNGNLSVSTGTPSAEPKKVSKESSSRKERISIRSTRSSLQKLDRAIRQDEGRLELRRTRLQAEHWEALKSGRSTARNSQSRLKEEIEDLEIKLKNLRQERSEIYEAGRKAGFLPGELDGKGIIP